MTSPQSPKICRFCGGPIVWGLKPNGRAGWHRPLDAASGRPSYMVFGEHVYYGMAYEAHTCKEEDIRAWDMKYERQKAREYPTKNETVPPPLIPPTREVSPQAPREERLRKPNETVIVGEFEKQAAMYLDCKSAADMADLLAQRHDEMVEPATSYDYTEKSGHASYRRRRDADHWHHALKVKCPVCLKRKGQLCVSVRSHQVGQNVPIKMPHKLREDLADQKFPREEKG